ncbi:putative zinc-binding protein [Anaeromyxobacter sp. PSR-1]|uniref:putative zinc-binding protein n=1 Tax=Anaeromyxobacter sp. PSR-1 TaxID=1300915 RepID=UPI0005E3F1C5|nr:putative zinc-binding protein [Anaeromyxobacter sp. PSR-1]GAO01506.1 DGC domain protein [Anaeromyxobacter sp. PSR-1]
MLNVIQAKAGIVSCSGEELAEGTVARLATLKVLHELRPSSTVTICLPLFLAGGEGDREFARFHPTITIDGCDLRCAARGTEMYSAKPAASIVVNELLDAAGLPRPEGRRCLNAAGRAAVDLVAERVAQLVDELARGRRSKPVAPATVTAGTGVDPPPGPDRSGRSPAR